MDGESPLPENLPELPPAPPRESLIGTAVKFLQNPKVSESPMEQRKQFLLKKGLTDKEIEIAVSRAGVSVGGGNAVPMSLQPPGHTASLQPVSTWARIREYSAIAIIVGGVVYGIYTLYKRFIEPLFTKSVKEQEEKLKLMEEGVKSIHADLGQNMQEIRATMTQLQEQITVQNQKLGQVAANLTSYKPESTYSSVSNSAIGELKAEITSVKGLLLSRNQFPAQPIMKPAIPSWQLKPPQDTSDANSAKPGAETAVKENSDDSKEDDASSSNGNGGDSKTSDGLYGKTQHLNGFASDEHDTQTDSDPALTSES